MYEIVESLVDWVAEGRSAAVATVIRVERSAPRGPGAAMALDGAGNVIGSVSGGCVEADLYEQLRAVLADGRPRTLTYGIADDEGFAIGLSCGGTIHLFAERLEPERAAPVLRAYAEEARKGGPVALVSVVAGPRVGAKLVVTPDLVVGGTGDPALDEAVLARVRERLRLGREGLCTVPPGGGNESGGENETELFIEMVVPPPRLFVFGATDFARALATVGKLLGYRVIACDARQPFATRERFPEADEVLCRWPHEVLEEADLGPRDAVCVLTHNPKFDVPALKVALNRPTGYVGALGSRRTQARRRNALRDAGLTEEQIDRIAAPIGLDIGAATPAEFAIAVMAEVVARRNGRSGGSLAASDRPIHAAGRA